MALYYFLADFIAYMIAFVIKLCLAFYAAAKAFYVDINISDQDRIGNYMEKYVRKHIFISDRYSLLHKSHDNIQNRKDYVESSLLPDFMFRDNLTGKEFYVEVKYRSHRRGNLKWSYKEQIDRYLSYSSYDHPVIIVIGVNWLFSKPSKVYLFELSKYPYGELFSSVLPKIKFLESSFSWLA